MASASKESGIKLFGVNSPSPSFKGDMIIRMYPNKIEQPNVNEIS